MSEIVGKPEDEKKEETRVGHYIHKHLTAYESVAPDGSGSIVEFKDGQGHTKWTLRLGNSGAFLHHVTELRAFYSNQGANGEPKESTSQENHSQPQSNNEKDRTVL